MNCVIENIEYLVHRHDCVVIPSWGALIANYVPARYDYERAIFFPPKREISFNPNITHNDGLVATSISRHNGISFERANKIVEEEVNCLRKSFDVDGEITLGSIGRFIRQAEGTPIFEPSETISRLCSFGFSELSIKPLTAKVTKEEETTELKTKHRRRILEYGARALKVAALIAIAVTICATFIVPAFNNRDDNLASVTSFSSRSSQTSVLPVTSDESHELYIAMPHEVEVVESSEIDIIQEVVEQEIRFNTADRYCLVVASFPTEQLAQQYIKENSGQLGIFSNGEKYRVYAATDNSSNSLAETKASTPIGNRFPDAWVCRMN